jgi:serine/threonine-protein kinase
VTDDGEDPQATTGVREGDVLDGKYRVEKIIGKGGMGVVVAARNLALDAKVALKFLLPSRLPSEQAVSRFTREARAAARITSEHVARVHDVGLLENGAPYIVMEFLEGEDLSQWLRNRGPLPIDMAVDFVLQASVAAADAHSLGIVHRDLKPANLFCVRRSDGQLMIKVLDFGISKVTGPTEAAAGVITTTGTMMGSPHYMSPEQMQSARDVDHRSDIWALGVIAFELLTGKVPFPGGTFGEIILACSTKPPLPLRSFRPEAPEALEAVVQRCLEKDPRARYANVAELALALAPFAPPRARASIDRIQGIVNSGGAPETTLPSGPPLVPPASGPPITATATIAPLGRTTSGRRLVNRRGAIVATAVGALAGALAFSAAMKNRGRDHADPPPTSATPALASTPAANPPAPSEFDATLPVRQEEERLSPLASAAPTTASSAPPPPLPPPTASHVARKAPPVPAPPPSSAPQPSNAPSAAPSADPFSGLHFKP